MFADSYEVDIALSSGGGSLAGYPKDVMGQTYKFVGLTTATGYTATVKSKKSGKISAGTSVDVTTK